MFIGIYGAILLLTDLINAIPFWILTIVFIVLFVKAYRQTKNGNLEALSVKIFPIYDIVYFLAMTVRFKWELKILSLFKGNEFVSNGDHFWLILTTVVLTLILAGLAFKPINALRKNYVYEE